MVYKKNGVDIDLINMSTLEQAVKKHEDWREHCLNMNAAESVIFDKSSEKFLISDLSRRAVLGRPGKRYSEGGKYIDEIEEITDQVACDLFNSKFSEWRPMSASVADGVLIHALTNIGENIIATPSPMGHPTWHEDGYAGFRGLNITNLPFDWNTLDIDYDKLETLISSSNFSLAIHGSSLILFPPDFKRLVKVLDNIPLWYDGAHVMGLIAAGIFPNPLNSGALVLSGSTQKTLSGPLGGLIVSNDQKIMDKVNLCASNDTATPDYGRIASLAANMIKWKIHGKKFSEAVVTNARSLGEELNNIGIKVLLENRGYTSTHQLAIVAPEGLDAVSAATKLSSANIITTPFPFPDGNGGIVEAIRLGTTEITNKGMNVNDMFKVAKTIKMGFEDVETAKRMIQEILYPDGNDSVHNFL